MRRLAFHDATLNAFYRKEESFCLTTFEDDTFNEKGTDSGRVLALSAPAIFLLSIGLAFVNIFLPSISGPNLAEYSWLLIAVALTIYELLYRKRTQLQHQRVRKNAREAPHSA